MEDPLSQRLPRAGIEQWVNPRNGLTVVRVHYKADPKKRTPEWRASPEHQNIHPRVWRREMEIDWTSPEGEPVIPEYEEARHCQAFGWDRSLRLLRWWDFGFVSPVVLFAQLTLWGQIRVRRELCPFNTPLNQLWEAVQAVTLDLDGMDNRLARTTIYDVGGREREEPEPKAQQIIDAGDPAGENDTDLGSSAAWLSVKGVVLRSARPGTEVSYANLRSRFLRNVMEPGVGPVPAIIIHPDCKNLRAALSGAFYRSPLPPHRPKKLHPEKDVVDALRYGDDNLLAATTEHEKALRQMALADVQPIRGAIVVPPSEEVSPWR